MRRSPGASAYVGPLTEVTDEQWKRIIDVNLSGVFYCAREAARAMMPPEERLHHHDRVGQQFHAGGRRARLCRLEGRRADADQESGPRSRSARHPGQRDRPRRHRAPKMLEAIRQLGSYAGAGERAHPGGPAGQPSEIASVAVFLASDESSFVTRPHAGGGRRAVVYVAERADGQTGRRGCRGALQRPVAASAPRRRKDRGPDPNGTPSAIGEGGRAGLPLQVGIGRVE